MHHHQLSQDTARMLMTRAPVTAAVDDSLLDAAARMTYRGIRHLPVVDGDRRVVGMLSDRDVRTVVGDTSRPLHHTDAVVRIRAMRVADAMTRGAYVIDQNATFADVVKVFTDHRIGAIPVVDEGGHLQGLISYVDVIKNADAL